MIAFQDFPSPPRERSDDLLLSNDRQLNSRGLNSTTFNSRKKKNQYLPCAYNTSINGVHEIYDSNVIIQAMMAGIVERLLTLISD